ncbi:MAG: serine/threonine protein kinase [Deltaproteobacteria bacterium]|nr:serine/threonine protein kinase [Nannocystaceae bacterium]
MSSSPTHDAPEQIGRFVVRRQLGAGGMGIVYAAFDPALDREVAVKLLRRDRFRPEQIEAAGERLRLEAQTAAKLAHPNVVTIFDVGTHDGRVYLAMELVDGPSLQQWIKETARPWREVLAMFFQAGRGLAAAHGVGLLHRDFKPTNVLVGGDHRPRVVDFGLAHFGAVPAGAVRLPDGEALSTASGRRGNADDAITTMGDAPGWDAASSGVFDPLPGDSLVPSVSITGSVSGLWEGRERVEITTTNAPALGNSVSHMDAPLGITHEGRNTMTDGAPATSTGLFVGTPAYMAPELFTGAGADARTDQFAFCVALYEALWGERPFAGQTAREIAANVTSGLMRPIPRSRIPGWLRSIVLRGLAVDPDQRHASLKSLLAAIAFTSRIMYE